MRKLQFTRTRFRSDPLCMYWFRFFYSTIKHPCPVCCGNTSSHGNCFLNKVRLLRANTCGKDKLRGNSLGVANMTSYFDLLKLWVLVDVTAICYPTAGVTLTRIIRFRFVPRSSERRRTHQTEQPPLRLLSCESNNFYVFRNTQWQHFSTTCISVFNTNMTIIANNLGT